MNDITYNVGYLDEQTETRHPASAAQGSGDPRIPGAVRLT